MSDTSKLKQCLAVYRDQVTLISAEIHEFDIRTSSIDNIAQWKKSLEGVRDKHHRFIKKMMVLNETHPDEINEMIEVFLAKYSKAMTLLDYCKELTVVVISRKTKRSKK